ncbi:type VI secretion system Vgr family protein [Massilia litorea]|uniref:Type VI secretion system tip protein VgrG n=1 Tax=Massilia litorea TaxID=2769491 RepID=A0A7L9U4I8_9BURK|nr:type VI secretion system Vgr family protein [Massilia litorea]QOL49035.1 type VI secretion system tip protein VgrG [Massilia litorea]
MDSASAFLRVLRHEQSLSTAHRALRLRLAHAQGLEAEALLPQQIVGSESVCGGLEYRVACVASDPALPLKSFIALPAEIQIVTDRGDLRSICGIVTEARAGDSDGSLTTYQLVLRDALAIMEKRVNSRIFRNQNELAIVQVLFDEWRHANAVLAGAFEYELDPLLDLSAYPAREQTMQYNESDAAFVRRLLRRRGICWCVRPGRSRGSTVEAADDRIPAHTLVLFADAAKLPVNKAGTVRYHRDDATEERDTITAWSAARSLQPGSASRHSWDYKHPGGARFMETSARAGFDQGGHGNTLAASLDDYLVEAPHAGNDVDDHTRLGQLRIARHGFEAKCFHGEGTVRDFCAGQYFTLAEHPEIDTHPAPEREFLITELQASVRNNLPGDMTARIERLLARSGWVVPAAPADGPVRVRFTAVRRGVPVVPAFDERTDLPHPQLQSALVVGPAGEEVHCDSLGRVRIRFPGMRTHDHEHAHGAGASGSPLDSAWVRVASNWAGNGPGSHQQCGALGLPRVGSEVLVAFLGGDPDKPIVLAQLFNGQALPPALSPNGELPGNRYLSGLRSREVNGQRGSQLRFDDTHGEIGVQLASDHGASELNLGWLARARANGEGKPRGEGAELRSEQAVAIRGRKGVLVTAEASPADEGQQLSRAGLIGLAELMQSVVDEMAKLAGQHAGDEAGSGRLAELVDKLKGWDSGTNVAPGSGGAAPIVAITAPAGIVLASQDNVALGSEKQVDLASGGDAQVSAGRNVFLRAARGISAFAHQLGIKLVAARGNVTLEAHQGNVEIKSSNRISLISAEAIHIEAPLVRIVSRGAQTEWAEGTITQQGSGKHVVKASSVVHGGPGGGTPATLDFAKSSIRTDERMVVRDLQTREPIPNQRYIAHLEDGSTIDGVSDESGRTSLVQSATLGPVRFELLP